MLGRIVAVAYEDRVCAHNNVPLLTYTIRNPNPLSHRFHESLELSVRNWHEVFVLGEGAFLDIGAELLERGDTLALQAFIFDAEVAIDFGVAWLMAARIAEYVLGEQILPVAT